MKAAKPPKKPAVVEVHTCPVPPAYYAELKEYALKLGQGALTISDEVRLKQIGDALARGIEPPAKVVGGVADHRSGRGRIPQRDF